MKIPFTLVIEHSENKFIMPYGRVQRPTNHAHCENVKGTQCRLLTPGGGGIECNMTGRCPFFKESPQPVWEKKCISTPCFGILDHKTIEKQ